MTLKKKILAFLSSEEPKEEVVQLAEAKLADGVIIVSDDFADGAAVFIKSEEDGEENVKLPVGEYSLEDGKQLVVSEEGIIESIGEAKQEDEPDADEPKEDEELAEEEKEEAEPQPEENVEELKAVIVELEAKIAELEAKQELAVEEPEAEPQVELSNEEPEAEPQPIVHVPADKAEKKPGFYFGKQ